MAQKLEFDSSAYVLRYESLLLREALSVWPDLMW